jgi:hypothetical protein
MSLAQHAKIGFAASDQANGKFACIVCAYPIFFSQATGTDKLFCSSQ